MNNKNIPMVEVPFCHTIVDGEKSSFLTTNSRINVSAERFEYFKMATGIIESYSFGEHAVGYALLYSIRVVLDKENTQKVNSLLRLNLNNENQVCEVLHGEFGDGDWRTTTGLFDHLMQKFEALKEEYDEICEASGLTERANAQKVMLDFDDSYVEVEIDSLPKIDSRYLGEQQILKVLSFFDCNKIDYKILLCCIKND